MKALVTGGRDWEIQFLSHVFSELDEIHAQIPITALINGKAKGFDFFCREWALSRNIGVVDCPADWKKYGNRAGPIRNREMFDKFHPELLIVGDGGVGTNHMLQYVISNVAESFPIFYIKKPLV